MKSTGLLPRMQLPGGKLIKYNDGYECVCPSFGTVFVLVT
jgi:hypothetical protein